MNEQELIAELVRRQGAEKDGPFAARLGVTRMAWRHVKGGHLRPGAKMLSGIGRAYPDLLQVVITLHSQRLFAPANDSGLTSADSVTTGAPR